MVKDAVQICSIVICVLSLMFMSRTNAKIQSLPFKPVDLSHEVIQSPFNKWSTDLIQNPVSELEYSEPGYDFDEEEMERLKLWPGGVIYYYIDDVSFDKVLRDRIRSFLASTTLVTGLQFSELPSPPTDEETRWVLFINRMGMLGCGVHSLTNLTTRGVQRVTLGYDCMSKGELAEVILMLAGVPAQHNAPDRDKYISVKIDHVMPDKRYLFEEVKYNEWLFYDLDYDYASAGHYHSHKYSESGQVTILTKTRTGQLMIGDASGFFSYTDVLKIRMLYNYISRNKLYQKPTCEKLFHPSSKPGEYQIPAQYAPRVKHPRYLGKPFNESHYSDETQPDFNATYEKNIDDDDKTFEYNSLDNSHQANDYDEINETFTEKNENDFKSSTEQKNTDTNSEDDKPNRQDLTERVNKKNRLKFQPASGLRPKGKGK